jgi:arylsulfatase A-like enzyme
MEWLFIVTKPSFMTNMNFLDKFEILIFVGSLSVILSILPLGFLNMIIRIPLIKKAEKPFYFIAIAFPTGILSALALILIDNFTYTVFRFGIVSTERIARGIYGIGFVILFVLLYRNVRNTAEHLDNEIQKHKKSIRLITIILAVILLGAISVPYFRHGTFKQLIPESKLTSSTNQLPNIILITSDGLNADHMSLYGYERDTTPFLKGISKSSLVAENAFSNSANTTGSTISILTGKYPTSTRVLYPPNILRNADSYEHLPGILKTLGYSTIQLGYEVYVDSYNMNLLSGFDEVNGRRISGSTSFDQLSNYLPGESAYFFYETFNRIFDRLRHIFFFHTMENAFLQVTTVANSFGDNQKIERLFSFLENKDEPVFAHIHWMGTHGERFYPEQQVFSSKKQKNLQMDWDLDFYDDSILELDQTIEQIYIKLTQEQKDSNTIFIVASDHGQHFVTNQRLPLIFLFPNSEYSNKLSMNAQNLDIAPTLLDYLGQDIPEWMEGDSLLGGLEIQRPIFAAGVGITELDEGFVKVDSGSVKPPFYQFGFVSMIDCDQWYQLNLVDSFSFVKSKIDSYNTSCSNRQKSDVDVLNQIEEYLKENRFDTSTLDIWIEGYSSN